MEADRPIQNSTEDRFGRWHFAQRIAQVIAKREESSSIIVGVHAPWGEGKTSVLNMIIQELKQHKHIVTVQFNPWRFPDETQLLRKFFSTLATKFDASLETRGEKLSGWANKYADVLSPIPIGGNAASRLVKAFTDERSKADLEELKTRIEQVLRGAGKRVVIIMDDIDRLDKEEVQAIFRLVKLSADFPNTAYILSFDEKRVAEALADKYGGIEGGRNFLEKIIQVPLPLPPASLKARRTLAVKGIEAALKLAEDKLTNEQEQRFVNVFDKAFLRRIATPRLAKRFANALAFALPILRGETDTIDLIFLEAIRAFYPDLYASIRENEEVYLGTIFDAPRGNTEESKEYATKIIEDALKGLSEQDNKAAKVVIQELFPRTGVSGMFGMGAYGAEYDAEWAKEKRIAAKNYFPRYFNYGVPPNDISDRAIKLFLEEIQTKGVDYAVTQIRELTTNERADILIGKLRMYEDELSPDIAKTLALGFAYSGNLLPHSHPTDSFFGLGAYAQASSMIRRLIQSIPDENEREQLALELADIIEPLPLAFEYSSWIRPLKTSRYSEEKVAVISSECETQIYKKIVTRIAALAHKEPLENVYPLEAQSFYQFWFHHDKEGVRSYLNSRISETPQETANFLVGVLGGNLSSGSNESFKIPDERGWYKFIVDMIDAETVKEALMRTFPNIDLAQPQADNTKSTKASERAARWFIRVHQQVLHENNPQSDDNSNQKHE